MAADMADATASEVELPHRHPDTGCCRVCPQGSCRGCPCRQDGACEAAGWYDQQVRALELREKLDYWRSTRRAPGRIQPGTMRYTPVPHDHTGQTVGHHLEHWSGRVDATVERYETVPLGRFAPTLEPAERGDR